MTFEEELAQILSQIPAVVERAFALVERHGSHNQKTHGNRFGGYGTTKESLRRLKDDKTEREKYKNRARKRLGQADKKQQKKQTGGSQLETLRSIEKDIRNQSYETAAIVDSKGSILLRKDGSKDYVPFTDSEVKLMRGASITHNHPSDNSFSPEDGYVLVLSGASEIRAVGKKWTHSLKPSLGKELDPIRVKSQIGALDSMVKQKFLREINTGKMTIQQAEADHWHEVWTEASKRIGFEYSREEL
jgi:NAD+--asparagine ADP-ribosyltransferase